MPSNKTVMLFAGVTITTAGIIVAACMGVYYTLPPDPPVTPLENDGAAKVQHAGETVLSGQVGVHLDGSPVECKIEGEVRAG